MIASYENDQMTQVMDYLDKQAETADEFVKQ